ncbi:MAG: 30S ribosomal protein S8e [Candidatus Nanohaloarchaea archaeon]
MAKRHTRSLRKSTGGRTRRHRKPPKSEEGGEFTASTLGESSVEKDDSRGNGFKVRVREADMVNVSVDGETETVEIESVLENPANPDYVRRDILTRGAVVDTEKGRVRITSRPGQEGTVNAVLLDED